MYQHRVVKAAVHGGWWGGGGGGGGGEGGGLISMTANILITYINMSNHFFND